MSKTILDKMSLIVYTASNGKEAIAFAKTQNFSLILLDIRMPLMDGYETAYIGDRKLTFKNQSRSTIDTQKLRTELPDIAKAYTKTTTSKVLKISQRVLKNV